MAKTDTQNMDFFEKVGYVFSLWNDSLKAFQLNIWTFIVLYVTPIALLTILSTFYIIPILADANGNTAVATGTTVIAVLVSLFVGLVYLLLTPAIILTQLESAKGNKISTNEALNRGLKYLWQYIVAAIVSAIIIAGPLLLSLLLVIVLIGLLLLPFAFLWAVAATFFLFLVPYIIINENLRAMDAIKQSYALTRKNWQWVLAVFIVTLLISVVASIPGIGYIISVILGILYLCLPAIVYLRYVAQAKPAPALVDAKTKPAAQKKSTTENKPTVKK